MWNELVPDCDNNDYDDVGCAAFFVVELFCQMLQNTDLVSKQKMFE